MDEFWIGVTSTIVLGVIASAIWALIVRVWRGLSGNPMTWRITRDHGFNWELERVGRTTARAVQIAGMFQVPGEFGPGVCVGPPDLRHGSRLESAGEGSRPGGRVFDLLDTAREMADSLAADQDTRGSR